MFDIGSKAPSGRSWSASDRTRTPDRSTEFEISGDPGMRGASALELG